MPEVVWVKQWDLLRSGNFIIAITGTIHGEWFQQDNDVRWTQNGRLPCTLRPAQTSPLTPSRFEHASLAFSFTGVNIEAVNSLSPPNSAKCAWYDISDLIGQDIKAVWDTASDWLRAKLGLVILLMNDLRFRHHSTETVFTNTKTWEKLWLINCHWELMNCYFVMKYENYGYCVETEF